MNRPAFPDIATIHVRVEERRLGVRGAGNWRVYEFTGIDAIPGHLDSAFGGAALPIQCHVNEVYLRRRAHGHLEDSYEVAIGQGDRSASVSRSLTISVRYRALVDMLPMAA